MCFLLRACIFNSIVFFILGKLIKILSIDKVTIATIAISIILLTIGYYLGYINGIKDYKDKHKKGPINYNIPPGVYPD